MDNLNWTRSFKKLYEKSVDLYQQGQRGADTFFDTGELKELSEIGYTAQELYDFAEDFCAGGDPDYDTALLIAAVRRDYFFTIQNKEFSDKRIAPGDLTGKDVEEEGIVWLPRIIEKAHAKLRGEMDPDLMYGCGGDRRFFQENNVHPADFLRVVWSAKEDRKKIIDYVKTARDQRP